MDTRRENCQRNKQLTISSILRILLTVSEARVMALIDTNKGWTTFSSKISVMAPFLTLMPAVYSPLACLFLNSVTVAMGLRPAFSANVYGTTSRASANCRKQYCSMPVSVLAYSVRRIESSISGAPPPAISALSLTRHLLNYRVSKHSRI